MLALGNLLLALTVAQAAPAADQTGRVTGRVTVDGANTPLAGVRIMLFPMTRLTTRPTTPTGMPPQAMTDQDGRYVFERILPGTYRVSADRNGYAPIGDAGRAPTLEVVAGQPISFDLQLQKGAVIAGRILDARGEPVTDARIMVLRKPTLPAGAPAMRGSMPRMLPAAGQGQQQTNDLGDYRVAGLAPGEYFVAVVPRGAEMVGAGVSTPVSSPPRQTPRTTLTTTFYPGTSDSAAAQPIAVAAAAEVANISFAIQSVPAFRVSGVVVDENGQPLAGAMVSLSQDPRNAMTFMGPAGMVRTRDDGRFEIPDAVAGSYRARAMVPVMMNGGRAGGITSGVTAGVSGGAIVSASGSGSSGSYVTWSSNDSSGGTMDQGTEVTIADADVSGVRVVVRRPARP